VAVEALRTGSWLHLTPHQLRHTFARQLTDAGMPITSLGKLMGHSQISTTQIYTAGTDPKLAQAYHEAMSRVEEVKLPHQQPESLPVQRNELSQARPIYQKAEGPPRQIGKLGAHIYQNQFARPVWTISNAAG